MLEVGGDQARAFRVAGHHLDRRVSASVAVAAVGWLGDAVDVSAEARAIATLRECGEARVL